MKKILGIIIGIIIILLAIFYNDKIPLLNIANPRLNH